MDATGLVSTIFDICHFYENLSRNSKLASNRTKMSGTLREDRSIFVVTGDIISISKRYFRVKLYQTVRIAEEV
jgi:hypothetical protein